MSFAVGTMSKPISMATNGCLISVPSLFSTSRVSYSIPYKPIKLQLSCKNISKRQESLFRVFVVASQQEENDLVILEEQEEEEEGQEIQENFNWAAPENDENEVDGFVEPPEGAKLYVGNLPYDVDSAKLAQLFETAGVVEISEVIYNRQTDQSRGFGFVTMSTEEEAEKAVEMFHGYDVNGRLLTVNIASPRGTRPERPPRTSEPGYKIYVGNLPWSVDDASLEKVFNKYGKVVSARLISDRETGRSRGFGFVVMSSESEMNDAISNLDGQSLDGRAMRVNAAAERQRRRSF